MKRYAVIKKLRAAARRRGLEFEEIRLTRHDAYRVGTILRRGNSLTSSKTN